MLKYFCRFCIPFLLCAQTSQANDKLLHFTTAAAATYTLKELGLSSFESWLIVNTVGLVKELADTQVDRLDILANVSGSTLAVIVIEL